MIKTFKILNIISNYINLNIIYNIYDSRAINFLSKSYFSTTRGHNFKLFVQHANFNIRKWFFSIRIVDIWNRLPPSVVNAPNVICFKKRLNKYWADLKIKYYHEAPLNYLVFNYTKINTPKNIDIDSMLSVETNAI